MAYTVVKSFVDYIDNVIDLVSIYSSYRGWTVLEQGSGYIVIKNQDDTSVLKFYILSEYNYTYIALIAYSSSEDFYSGNSWNTTGSIFYTDRISNSINLSFNKETYLVFDENDFFIYYRVSGSLPNIAPYIDFFQKVGKTRFEPFNSQDIIEGIMGYCMIAYYTTSLFDSSLCTIYSPFVPVYNESIFYDYLMPDSNLLKINNKIISRDSLSLVETFNVFYSLRYYKIKNFFSSLIHYYPNNIASYPLVFSQLQGFSFKGIIHRPIVFIKDYDIYDEGILRTFPIGRTKYGVSCTYKGVNVKVYEIGLSKYFFINTFIEGLSDKTIYDTINYPSVGEVYEIQDYYVV